MQALKSGLGVYYASLSRLIADLKRAHEQNRLERRWRVYLRPDILIIDEVDISSLTAQRQSFCSGSSARGMSMAALS